ncbi:MAG: Crp/Fnr family transcriptional regulator [Clostridia bacterium]
MNNCLACLQKLCMHKVPIFTSLNQEELRKIASLIQHQEYQKGEALFVEGALVSSLIIINEGSAKAFRYTSEGREQILYIFAEGDFLGEQNLLSNQRASYTVEALANVKLCLLAKQEFQQLLEEYPTIAVKIIAELGSRMTRLENSLQSIGVRSIDARICSLLLDFSLKYGKAVPEGILLRLPLSREGMANYLGIARETISRKLGQFENEGLIRGVSNKELLILERDKLAALAGELG